VLAVVGSQDVFSVPQERDGLLCLKQLVELGLGECFHLVCLVVEPEDESAFVAKLFGQPHDS
jgi:hypothetical protein